MSRISFACIAAMLAISASATSIKWTGYAKNGQWETATNWYPDQVPGAADDVTINHDNVTITTPVVVQSISMGNTVGQFPFLIVDSPLTVESTFEVQANGGVVLNSGAASVSGQVTMGGNLVFQAGTVSGTWTVASPGKADLSGQAEKAFSACQFNIGIDVDISGLIILNQSSVISTTSTMTASGDLTLQNGDGSAVSFDTSKGTFNYMGMGTFQVQAPWSVGTFNLMGGNLTLFDSVTFGSAFEVPSGSTVRTLGMAAVMMPAGVTGAGYIHVEGQTFSVGGANFSGIINAQAGVFESSSSSMIGTLMVSGSNVKVDYPLSVGTISLTAGQLQGSSTLTVAAGTLMSAGFNVNVSTVFTGDFTATGSVIALGVMGKITVASGATFTASGAVQFSGPPGTGGLHNHGTIMASGTLTLTNVDLSGSGSVSVSGELNVQTITMTQAVVALTGNGKFIGATTEISNIGSVTGSPGVVGSIGSYSFTCNKMCSSISTVGIPTTSFIFSVSS